MFQKNDSKLITSDVKLINEQLKTVELDKSFKRFIDRNIFFIKKELKNLAVIKKTGSYAIDCVYNFDKEPKIDLLAIKYVNKGMYSVYEEEIETKDHFTDCWICEINEEIYKKLKSKYEVVEEIKVNWNSKKYKIYPDSKETVEHRDSIKIDFYKDDKIGFSIVIRTGLTHADYPPILCFKNTYETTNAVEFVKTYWTLNKLTIRKLEILFFYIRLNFRRGFSNEQRLMMKIMVMSDLQYQLTKNNIFQEWLTHSFKYLFPNLKVIDSLFESKNIYYKKQKLFEKLYKSFRLKNLNWVFHNTYLSTKDFLDKYLPLCKEWVAEKKYLNEPMYFWYDTNPYLKNTSGSSNYTMKKQAKKYDDLEMSIHSKNVYPSDNDIGVFLVFLSFYQFKIQNNKEEE
ncbi:hypothetical protein SCHIN_v1c05340 [Spiroplasma chinense]|uniref:Nucleotidyltransferase n=1 Tax=Spiroplasma chinense TaxID=216932 RepID=A0A5B9Y3X9_9MOLU|nr:hypothetical protein [Spiroplasma chinense]QEH61731.1 hypothetical protein SCHIN_v1c05340 [Spiroplasma chinense]